MSATVLPDFIKKKRKKYNDEADNPPTLIRSGVTLQLPDLELGKSLHMTFYIYNCYNPFQAKIRKNINHYLRFTF